MPRSVSDKGRFLPQFFRVRERWSVGSGSGVGHVQTGSCNLTAGQGLVQVVLVYHSPGNDRRCRSTSNN